MTSDTVKLVARLTYALIFLLALGSLAIAIGDSVELWRRDVNHIIFTRCHASLRFIEASSAILYVEVGLVILTIVPSLTFLYTESFEKNEDHLASKAVKAITILFVVAQLVLTAAAFAGAIYGSVKLDNWTHCVRHDVYIDWIRANIGWLYITSCIYFPTFCFYVVTIISAGK